MHRMGTVANILRYVTAPDGTHHLICQGEQRFQVIEFLSGWPFLVARVLRIPEPDAARPRSRRASCTCKARRWRRSQLLPQAPQELVGAIQASTSPARSPISPPPTWT